MRGARPFSVPVRGVVPAVLAVAFCGCTMCPDCYDYSGPVPNGSAPQNDFRARSNGILPIGGSPHPWPTIVKDSSQGSATSATASTSKTPRTRGRKPAAVVASRGEVKQLSAEESNAEKAEAPVSEPDAKTVPVIGEDEDAASTGENSTPAAENDGNQTIAADETETKTAVVAEPVADEEPADPDLDSAEVMPVSTTEESGKEEAPQVDDVAPAADATGPSPEAPSAPEPLPPASEPDEAASNEPAAEAEEVEQPRQPRPIPKPLLRETPGWRPRRPLDPGQVVQ
jgi:hypothetical protein